MSGGACGVSICGARAEANPAQELYLVVDDAADADVVHLFELCGDPAEMQRNAGRAVRRLHARVGPLLAEPPVAATGTPVWAKGAPT